MMLLKTESVTAEKQLLTSKLSVEDVVRSATFEEAVLKVSQAYDFHHHPYLLWMQLGSTSRSEFLHTQIPVIFAIESFSQALAAVLARTPVLEQRLSLFENVAEEHGQGKVQHSHKYTFRQFLCALGATPEDLNVSCPAFVLAFNQSLLNYCLTQPGEAGAAALGILEHLYVDVSAAIAHTVTHRGWTAPGSQTHYTVHEELDVEHARELLILAEPVWNEPRSRTLIAQGLMLGAHYLWNLYLDLL